MQRNHMNSHPTHLLSRTQPLNHKSQTFVHNHRYGHFHACAGTETRHRHYGESPVLCVGSDAYRRSLGRRSLYWLGRRYRACLAPQPAPPPHLPRSTGK